MKASHMSMMASERASLLIESLPADWREARLLGRLQLPEGPPPVLIEKGRVYDVSKLVPAVADAVAHPDRLIASRSRDLGPLESLGIRAAVAGTESHAAGTAQVSGTSGDI